MLNVHTISLNNSNISIDKCNYVADHLNLDDKHTVWKWITMSMYVKHGQIKKPDQKWIISIVVNMKIICKTRRKSL